MASRASARLVGAPQMLARIRQLMKSVPVAVARALYQETQIEATEVKKRTPVWNSDRKLPKGVTAGALRASVHTEGPTRSGTSIYMLIVAGGVTAPYALFVHEDLLAFHKVGQAKYLESVLDESRPYMAARVARRIDLRAALLAEEEWPGGETT